MISKYVLAIACVVALFVAACSQLGVPAPQTLGEKLAYSEGQDTAFNESIPMLAQSGAITKAQAQSALDASKQAMAAITAGRTALKAGDSDTASGKLAQALSFLADVSAYLKGGTISP